MRYADSCRSKPKGNLLEKYTVGTMVSGGSLHLFQLKPQREGRKAGVALNL
jgi:hypothetical protein